MTQYVLAFWNVENLFAPEGYPAREPWIAERLKNDLKGWTEDLFRTKIRQLGIIIRQIGGAGPDLLGVCEVENRFVLETLAEHLNDLMPERAYRVVHADSSKDQRGIDTAFIYDSKKLLINENEIFSHFVMRRTGTRDITQCTFITKGGRQFIALSNHWPSRSGGAVESAGFRMTAGETLGYWHQRIREEKGNDIAVIAFGDFNDDPSDASLRYHANSTRERDDVESSQSAMFYNLAWNYLRQPVMDSVGSARTLYGTLYFNGDANIFDQILVSRSLLSGTSGFSVREETAKVEAIAAMVSHSKNEGPIRFGLSKGDAVKNVNLGGFSDHFPVSVVIEENDTIV
ncbi:endonuclease/exonuclease/phosphatase family protein [Agrobacterium fabrum]|uniref:endonuclease/exonuclease/phosphatase family protein n=1 Tax=Agrobacterium fabrum TaxID=1176649 RepID=UPI000EF5210E|nr:endonuclease/exonuclease/phosphatase family protein [Agrobacterium fabrum]AYM57725.1 endonuclease [Agrobacterium fabrum]NSZ12072.1 endonuclease [Agrobacterium fabrum]